MLIAIALQVCHKYLCVSQALGQVRWENSRNVIKIGSLHDPAWNIVKFYDYRPSPLINYRNLLDAPNIKVLPRYKMKRQISKFMAVKRRLLYFKAKCKKKQFFFLINIIYIIVTFFSKFREIFLYIIGITEATTTIILLF